jgi:SAM-dependent methyltransferase
MTRRFWLGIVAAIVGFATATGCVAADDSANADKKAAAAQSADDLAANKTSPADKTSPARTPGRDDAKKGREPDVVYVPTPHDIVTKMLDMGHVTRNDVVYDLGCGDGRIVVAAAKRGARSIGFEISPVRIQEANANVKKAKVEKLASIQDRNIFTVDLRPASVVTMYLLPGLNARLVPQLDQLKPGSRIVVKDYPIRDVKADKETIVVSKEDGQSHTLYLYSVPLNKIETKSNSKTELKLESKPAAE